jgi:DNA-binding NarL/FixJ family response regulator
MVFAEKYIYKNFVWRKKTGRKSRYMDKLIYIICDNEDLTRIGLVALLDKHEKNPVIELAIDKKELKILLDKMAFSLVVIDFETFDFDSLEEIDTVVNQYKETRWLFIAQHINESFFLQLTSIIPHANFVLKTDNQEDIVSAILSTQQGKKYYCSEALEIILGRGADKDTRTNPINHLTRTEKEIVQLLAYGKTTKEIAVERCLSFHTVNTHRKNIFKKLEVTTVHDLTKLALKYGLVDLTEYYI